MDKSERMDKAEAKIYLLYMLRKLYNITESYNIPIYASGGTCLGMVRHKGMIPWDDDIDLMIFRKDYQRFVEACQKELTAPFVLRTRENDPYFYQEFAKICLVDDDGNYTDLSIDVFELDETNPERRAFREVQNKMKNYLYFLKMYKVSRLGYGCYSPESFGKKVVLTLGSVLPLKTIDSLLYKTLTAEKTEGDYVVNWGAAYSYKKATYPKLAFGIPQKMPFENTYVWAAEHPEMILERLYGKDYMTPPSPEKQTDHGVRSFRCSKLNLEEIKQEVGM